MTDKTPPHHTKPQLCLHCGELIDRASNALDDVSPPKAGDITLCLYCAGAMVFVAEDGAMRQLTADESTDVDNDPRVRMARMAIRAMNKGRRP